MYKFIKILNASHVLFSRKLYYLISLNNSINNVFGNKDKPYSPIMNF